MPFRVDLEQCKVRQFVAADDLGVENGLIRQDRLDGLRSAYHMIVSDYVAVFRHDDAGSDAAALLGRDRYPDGSGNERLCDLRDRHLLAGDRRRDARASEAGDDKDRQGAEADGEKAGHYDGVDQRPLPALFLFRFAVGLQLFFEAPGVNRSLLRVGNSFSLFEVCGFIRIGSYYRLLGICGFSRIFNSYRILGVCCCFSGMERFSLFETRCIFRAGSHSRFLRR